MELITLDDVRKTYYLGEVDVPVLKGVSATVRQGELVALTGQSGSGKSTLMNILGCLDRPTGGRYWLDGVEVSELTLDDRAVLRGRKIGFVFQNFNLLARTSALDNVMMPLAYAVPRTPDREGRERAKGLLNLVGLADRRMFRRRARNATRTLGGIRCRGFMVVRSPRSRGYAVARAARGA